MKFPFKIISIVAMDEGRGIGFENGIPWHLPEDQKRFSQLTTGQTVLMGRKTYQSLPEKFRPLPKRKNIVISRAGDLAGFDSRVSVFTSVTGAVDTLLKTPELMMGNLLWIIGGGLIYRDTLDLVDEIDLTLVDGRHQADTFFPPFEEQFELESSQKMVGFEYRRYRRSGSLPHAP